MRTYANDLLSDYRNVVLVVINSTTVNNSLLGITGYNNVLEQVISQGSSRDPFEWICDDRYLGDKIDLGPVVPLTFNVEAHPCYTEVSKLEAVADQWVSGAGLAGPGGGKGYAVSHCLAEQVEGMCSLHFSLDLAVIVMTFNLIKIFCMTYVAFWIRDSPLITVGDAVDSFLRVPDATSKGSCLLGREEVVAAWDGYENGYERKLDLHHQPVTYRPKRHKWSSAASGSRWCITLSLHVPLPLTFQLLTPPPASSPP